jgi:transposase
VNNSVTYVAMDTHKKQHRIALQLAGQKPLFELTITNSVREINKMVKKIVKKAPGPVAFCYEAGVCGFTLKRRIEKLGARCIVIAPSLVPKKPGERVKTDRRDARKLLGLFQADLLTEVQAPDEKQEADRELTRLRETAMENLKRSRHQLLKFLTRHGFVYTDGRHWTQKHLLWLRGLEWTPPMLSKVFEGYFDEMTYCHRRLESLDQQVEMLANQPEYQAIVGALRCFHGIDTLTAITLVTEIFDYGRFATPRELMSYLGLTPSEKSSGEKQKKGSITKAGNKRIRRLLNEAAWHYRHRYLPGKVLQQRRKGQPEWAIAIADAAGRRLSRRHRHLLEKGKMPCKANIAVARELAGFIWALMKEYEARKTIKEVA